MNKQKKHAFNKDIYLLGVDANGVKYWLEAPSWDCGHYWGFGYIETYTNNNGPENARDISSHQHATNFMAEYFIKWNGSKPLLTDKTFDEKEGWELSELFAQFYHLKEAANFWNNGKMNVAGTKIKNWTNKELAIKINQELIPVITARILEILSPNAKK